MNSYNSIVIGSGLGGLIAGATLAKRGQRVLLLEQHYLPGGCATSFKRKNFVFEVGLHELDGLHSLDSKVEILAYLNIFENIEFVKVPELFHLFRPEVSFTFPHGEKEAKDKLIENFPDDKKGIDQFFSIINGVLLEIPKIPQSKFISTIIYPIMPLLFPNVVKSSRITIGCWLDQHIKNEQLKLLLTTNLIYYGDDPYDISMMYYSAAQGSYIGGGGHFIKGGSQKLSDYLTSFIEEKGGQVILGKKVNKIIVKNNKAVGVEFSDSFNKNIKTTEIYADNIIVNAAVPNVIKMLPKEYEQKAKKRIDHLEESCSLISIYIGFNIDLKQFGVKHYSTFFQGEDIQMLSDLKKNFRGNWENKSFVFVDYSQVNSNLCPEGKSVGVICAADYLSEWENLDKVTYNKKKEEVAQFFFTKLEEYYPGILKFVEHYEIATAKTIERYTLNPKGTPYGFAQKLSQSARNRDFSIPQLKNLYFASAWTFPGGGYSGAIISGFITANKVAEKKILPIDISIKVNDERQVKLIEKKYIAENTIELTFEKPNSFVHQAGQYVILKIDQPIFINLDLPIRSLSIISDADESKLRFAMRLGESSFKRSIEKMALSDTATIYGPIGNFSITDLKAAIVFLVSGIGITPVLPLIKKLESIKHKGEVRLFYSNKSDKSTAYHKELSTIQLDDYHYYPIFTNSQKRLNEAILKDKLIALNKFKYYIVGTNDFIKAMNEILYKNHVPLDDIKVDDFG